MVKNDRKKGSLTVEAACVMPLIFFAVLGLLYLCFFVHNRAWLTAAAYEAALSGSMEAAKEDGRIYETAQMRSRELGSIGFFGAENLTSQTNVGGKVRVVYDLDTIVSYGGLSWHLRTEGEASVLEPARWIRRVKSAAEVAEGLGG